ncbi:MAG: hypothetical protein JWO35_557 [Candidatus Saccharibacteria bacterium]|nr:hypothetical protein [Candidatus Saccharibacteria bacterium]
MSRLAEQLSLYTVVAASAATAVLLGNSAIRSTSELLDSDPYRLPSSPDLVGQPYVGDIAKQSGHSAVIDTKNVDEIPLRVSSVTLLCPLPLQKK